MKKYFIILFQRPHCNKQITVEELKTKFRVEMK